MADAPQESGSPPTALTHLDEQGRARMVDVGGKPVTHRQAVAEGFVTMQAATLDQLVSGALPKGEALGTARIAGILGAKRCGELIPLCHPLPLESVAVQFEPMPSQGRAPDRARLRIEATATITARTGVEMEALTAVSVAALTVYDMCKAVDRTLGIEGIRLLRKTGGTRHGDLHGDVQA